MRPWAQNPFKKRLRKGYCLRPESAESILHAERFAYALNRRFTFAITINFNAPVRKRRGKPTPRHYDVFRKAIWHNLCRRWNRMQKATGSERKFAAIAVFENPPNKLLGKRHYGPLHVHMMLDWPEKRVKQLRYFLHRALSKHLVRFQPHHIFMRKVYRAQGFAAYMAKGIDPPYAEHFYVTHKPQGPINHRRIIVSRSLGEAARNKFKAAGGNPLPNRRTKFTPWPWPLTGLALRRLGLVKIVRRRGIRDTPPRK